jgi:hypothetical protein
VKGTLRAVVHDGSLPFDRYTGGGRQLLGIPAWGDGSSRRGYGRAVFEQCGFACAYCGHSMETGYEVWLSLSVDHVIPVGSGKLLGYPSAWIQDTANQVTCCRACNEFLNGYRVTDPPPATGDEFFKLRDRHFLAKRDWVQARHARERAWYDAAFARPPAEPE